MQDVSFVAKNKNNISRGKKPTLDVIAPRRTFVSPQPLRFSNSLPYQKAAASLPLQKGLDGVRRERQNLLRQLREQSLEDTLLRSLRKAELFFRRTRRILTRLLPDIAPRKMLYGSLVGGVAFGMLSMAFIGHFFGAGVFARSTEDGAATPAVSEVNEASAETFQTAEYDFNNDVFFEYFKDEEQEEYEANIRKMVEGYPIEAMLPEIFAEDRLTAAFLIGIAKKESNWGKRVPVLDGQDCFNYWGYRGIRRMMGTGGHTCFNSRKDAVDTVATRLEKLIHSAKLNTPEKMIVWKCGSSCAGHSRESVKKWISDVDMYFSQLKEE